MLGADIKGTPYCQLEDKFLTTLKCQPHAELLTEDAALHSPHHWPVPDCLCPGPPGAHWKAEQVRWQAQSSDCYGVK